VYAVSARAFLLAGLVAAGLLGARPADAHLMPAGHGTLNVVGDAVFGVVSVPVSALHGFDDDGDGLLEIRELERHYDTLAAEIGRRFVVSDGDVAASTVHVDLVLSPQHEAAPDRADQVVALEHARFAGPPVRPSLACDLFGADASGQELAFTATRHPASGAEVETTVLSPSCSTHRFFAPSYAMRAGYGVAPVVVVGMLLAGLRKFHGKGGRSEGKKV
jgi:hypothetical protein